ncbi:MAG: hypothetical protein EBX40_02615 [Gammaproteobacteria bacterium]|nr:hypothetical protein [Gammaproteobacteria bacterium]
MDTESGRVDFNDHPSLQAKIVLVADGAESSLRRQLGIVEERVDYHQTAVVTSVTLNRPHEEWAFERFCQDRTLALLPLSSQRAAVILSLSNQESEKVISFNELEFIEYLQNEFGYRLGRFLTRGPMHHYPLYQVLAQESHRGRFLLIGSAAHHLSPVAAQGFNLSLRDVDTFRSLMSLNAFSPDIFDRYDIARQKDQSQVVSVTHRISTLFGDTRLSIQVARKLGISMFERSLLAKRYFVDLIMGDEGD